MAKTMPKYIMVKEDFWHSGGNDMVEVIEAALDHMSHSGSVRVLFVVQEIDLSEWTTCPHCGRAVETPFGCWRPECLDAQRAEGVET